MIRSTTKNPLKNIKNKNVSLKMKNSVMHVYPSLNKCTCRYIVSYSSIQCTFIAELHVIILSVVKVCRIFEEGRRVSVRPDRESVLYNGYGSRQIEVRKQLHVHCTKGSYLFSRKGIMTSDRSLKGHSLKVL